MQPEQEESYPGLPALDPEGHARAAALRTAQSLDYRPVPLVSYESGGTVLVIGPEQTALQVAHRLPPQMDRRVLAVQTEGPVASADAGTPRTDAPDIPVVRAPLVKLEGYLGRFRTYVRVGDTQVDLQSLSPSERADADLVLDLTNPPQLTCDVPPAGYFAPGDDPTALDAALRELPELVGTFEKPTYFDYDPDICAHSRSGLKACTRCIDACPTEAITPAGDRGVAVDSHLCQGAGVCATACPTGAIRYTYPRLADHLRRVRELLRSYREAGGARPLILFHDADAGRERILRLANRLPENVVPAQVEEIGSVGMDLGLAALAYGAHRVLLLGTGKTAARVVREIEAQLTWARTLLEAMGYPSEALCYTDARDPELLEDLAADAARMHLREPAAFAALDDKRRVIRLALDHLHRQAPAPRPLATLTAGAPFGDVWLTEDRCTLCMACVSQCPGKALLPGDDSPQLRFVEDNCVQCGLCARACPEDAIGTSPRYLFDDQARRRMRLLKEEEPFLCIRCGTPFATRSVILKVSSRLKGNPNLGPAEFKRLQMCEECRGKDLLEAEQARATADAGETQP